MDILMFEELKKTFMMDLETIQTNLYNKNKLLKSHIVEYENFHFKYFIYSFDLSQNIDENKDAYLIYLFSKGFSFDTITQDIISNVKKYKSLYFNVCRVEFILRHSKTYKSAQLIKSVSEVSYLNKKSVSLEKYRINHNVFKFFTISENNKVKIFYNNKIKYISFKNIQTFKKNGFSLDLTLNKILQIHLNSNIDTSVELFVSNKILYGHNSIDDALLHFIPNLKLEKINFSDKQCLLFSLSVLNKKLYHNFSIFFNLYYDTFRKTPVLPELEFFLGHNYVNDYRNVFVKLFLFHEYELIKFKDNRLFFSYMSINKMKQISNYVNNIESSFSEVNYISYNKLSNLLLKERIKTIKTKTVCAKQNQKLYNILLKKFNDVKLITKKDEIFELINKYLRGQVISFFESNEIGAFFEITYKEIQFMVISISNKVLVYGKSLSLLCYFNIFDNVSYSIQFEIHEIISNLKILEHEQNTFELVEHCEIEDGF